MGEKRGNSCAHGWGHEIQPKPIFPINTDSKNYPQRGMMKIHGPGPKIRWRSTYKRSWTKIVKW